MTTAPPAHAIDSWSDLAQLIEACAEDKWLFRGESSASHDLKPKAGRVGSERGAARKHPYDLSHEREALQLFKRQARPCLGHAPASDLEWLAIAQHHGMSTRLLDWSESLLVAAYFATAEAGTRGDALIYGIRALKPVGPKHERDPFSLAAPVMYRPPHITPRIPAQRSVFTVHPDPTQPFVHRSLSRWVISSNACNSIKRVLDACAVNESALSPDIDGLSRYIGWKYKWAKL